MLHDDEMYSILLEMDKDALHAMCKTDDHIKNMCHQSQFVKAKMALLPITIYRPIKPTLHNLFYVYDLIDLAIKLKKHMKNNGYQFFYEPIKNIVTLQKIDPFIADQLLESAFEQYKDTNFDEIDNVIDNPEDTGLDITYI